MTFCFRSPERTLRVFLVALVVTNLSLLSWSSPSPAQASRRNDPEVRDSRGGNQEEAERLRREFERQVSAQNRRIQQAQDELQSMINNPNASEAQIRAKQRELSTLRAQRDELATGHILQMRRLRGQP